MYLCMNLAKVNEIYLVTSEEVVILDEAPRPASVALLVGLWYTLSGYGDRRVWVRGPVCPDHCVRL